MIGYRGYVELQGEAYIGYRGYTVHSGEAYVGLQREGGRSHSTGIGMGHTIKGKSFNKKREKEGGFLFECVFREASPV